MSSEEEAAAAVDMCACCGIGAVDDVKLKKCACDLVKYCSDGCRELDRPEHAGVCRKRLAEIHNDNLLKQPNSSHLGECPICFLPLSLDMTKSVFMSCCSKMICLGCNIANQKREIEGGLQHRCAFCREPLAKTKEESNKRMMKRIKKNDPVAMCRMGKMRHKEGDYETAFKYYTKAAEMGDAAAHYNLSGMYYDGEGVEKDVKKYKYHLEEAAIAGHPEARHNLGCEELDYNRFERAKKHFIFAANLGDHDSLEALRRIYANGFASKEDYAGALRGYQAAVQATKSPERERAEEEMKNGVWINVADVS
jgi:tetratricopeptide (TPR) repeat protein